MNKLFGLLLLALACWSPDLAHAAARFAVCTTTCTWDNTSTAMWSTTSGGATGASAPTSSDDVTLDANTCVGGTTCTITTFAGTLSIQSLTQSACTASTAGCILDLSANNTTMTVSGSNCYINTGSGTRTLNMGNGTWTCSSNTALWNVASSMTLNAGSSTLTFSGTASTQIRFTGGGKTYATVSVVGAAGQVFGISGSNTIGTLTLGTPIRAQFDNTQTITTLTNISGSGSSVALLENSSPLFNNSNSIVLTNSFTCSYCAISALAFSGGSASATNSFDLGRNSGITITGPSAGGGGGRIIGG